MQKVGPLSGAKHQALGLRSVLVVLGLLVFISVASGQSANSYVDTEHRFTIQVPAGWQAKPFNAGGVSGVTIAHGGDAYVQIFLQKGIDPATFLKALNTGVQTNHPGYQVLSRGVKEVAGLSRTYIVGESPGSATAPHTQVDLETFSANGYTIAVIASASDMKPISKEKIADYQVAQGMIQSLSLNGVVARGPSATPAAPFVPPTSPKTPPPADTKPALSPTSAPANVSANLTEEQKKMASLDTAVKSGVITREEYIAKKNQAIFEQSAQQTRVAKLKILDEAFDGGVLTKEEYERKKKELGVSDSQPRPPEVQPPTQSHPPVQTAEVASKADITPGPPAITEPATPPAAARVGPPASNAAPVPATVAESHTVVATPPSGAASPTSSAMPSVAFVPASPAAKPVEPPVAKSEPVPPPTASIVRSVPSPAPTAWITHTDPTGFEVSIPANWTVGDPQTNGQVSLRGTRGEEIMIWPIRVQNPQLNAHDASVLTQTLALRFDALMPWGPTQNLGHAARAIGVGSDRSGAAILSWSDNPNGASAYFCALEAPSKIFANSTEAFVAILKSFHVVSNSPVKNLLPTASGTGKVNNFVNWKDPHEDAFSVTVPQGWHVIGGTYRLSPVDVRYAVVMDSPDGQLRASVGDSMVGAFTQPTPELAAKGLVEGNYQLLDDGSKLEILQYMSGQKFVRSYVETIVSRECSHPQFSYGAPREDLAAVFSQSASEEGFSDGFLTAGEVEFSCSLDGRQANGKFVAATLRVGHAESAMWFVYRLYGFVALAGREQDGEKIMTQILQTLKFNSKWQALKKTTADPSVEAEDPLSHEIQQRAEEDIIDDQRQTTEMTARSYEQRKRVYDAVDHKLENAVLGTVEIVDRENGTHYKISDFDDFHFVSTDGYIYSPNSPGASEQTLRELLTLPPGI